MGAVHAPRSGAFFVALGIFLSRISGLVRERVFAHYFGNSAAGDAFKAALKIPNFLQNLFGEGALSASFIPVYAKLRAEGRDREAEDVARVVASFLGLITTVLVVLGMSVTPFLIDGIAPGFTGETRQLTIDLVRLFFPGTGLLVLSAWCLGILNSHRRFFLSYAAPVLWNVAIIAALLFFATGHTQASTARIAAYGLLVGSLLQFLVQLPRAWALVGRFRPSLSLASHSVRTVFANFLPAVLARGVVQVSAYIDTIIASFLPIGSVSALAYAQTLYLLPVSLFGMAVSASELPALSSATGSREDIACYLKIRLEKGLATIAFFVIPSVLVFIVLGDVVVSALFQSGAFNAENTRFVWMVLIGSAIGLVANTNGRLYASVFYALKDTRTPLRFAIVRVVLTSVFGYVAAIQLPSVLDLAPRFGTVGLAASAGFVGWIEYLLLRRASRCHIGRTGLSTSHSVRLWGAACLSAGLAFLCKVELSLMHPMSLAMIVLPIFSASYLLLTAWFKIDTARGILARVRRRA